MANKLFIMMGAPGSGKSTWVKKQLKDGDRYVSRDEIRFSILKDGEEYFSHEGVVFQTFIDQIAEGLANENIKRVFADASHLNPPSRAKLLNGLKSIIDMRNIEVNVIWLRTSLMTCIKRNNLRNGRANVPERTIRDMWNSQKFPTEREGISKVYVVDETKENIEIIDLTEKEDENGFVY